jgi:FkbM family methyltransferase
MEENLKRGDLLFDVGAEIGWISSIYAQFVGGENMCLFEPCIELCPSILGTWKESGIETPKCCTLAFVGDTEQQIAVPHHGCWPDEAKAGQILTNTKFRHINEDGNDIPRVTLDAFIARTGYKPNAVTIDVEGAELMVLRGAERMLRELRPLVWVSIHEEAVTERYQQDPKQIYALMESCGYDGTNLGFDHEAHWMFKPR